VPWLRYVAQEKSIFKDAEYPFLSLKM
jgi:hypothetical protein